MILFKIIISAMIVSLLFAVSRLFIRMLKE